jgi:hypothetical protein
MLLNTSHLSLNSHLSTRFGCHGEGKEEKEEIFEIRIFSSEKYDVKSN